MCGYVWEGKGARKRDTQTWAKATVHARTNTAAAAWKRRREYGSGVDTDNAGAERQLVHDRGGPTHPLPLLAAWVGGPTESTYCGRRPVVR